MKFIILSLFISYSWLSTQQILIRIWSFYNKFKNFGITVKIKENKKAPLFKLSGTKYKIDLKKIRGKLSHIFILWMTPGCTLKLKISLSYIKNLKI